MRFRPQQSGDTRIISRFLWWPRTMHRRLKLATPDNPAGTVTARMEGRFWERATWKQQYNLNASSEGWTDISWEDIPEERRSPIGPPT